MRPLCVDLEHGSSEAVKRVVAGGIGVGCRSREAVAEALAGGWLVEVRTRLPRAARALSIVAHRVSNPGARGIRRGVPCDRGRRDA